MPSILPSQIISAIDSMFGPNRTELGTRAIQHVHKAQVHALLAMLDEVPTQLIDLNARDYLEFSQCRAVLATALPAWNLGDIAPANTVGGKDPIERIRRLMMQCHDQLPQPEPELPFIAEDDVRLGIEDRIQAAWTDFNAREWMGATVLAGHATSPILSFGSTWPFCCELLPAGAFSGWDLHLRKAPPCWLPTLTRPGNVSAPALDG